MPNKEPPISSALLGLPKVPKAPLLQHVGERKLNMVVTRKLSWTFGSILMISSVVRRVANAHGYSIGLKYLMSSLFLVALI